MIARRDVETPVAAAQRRDPFLRGAQIAGDALELGAFQSAQIAFRPQQRLYAMSARDQFVDEIRADEPGRAGDKTSHVGVIERSNREFNSIPTTGQPPSIDFRGPCAAHSPGPLLGPMTPSGGRLRN